LRIVVIDFARLNRTIAHFKIEDIRPGRRARLGAGGKIAATLLNNAKMNDRISEEKLAEFQLSVQQR
jgi:hypothetical protein